jgi:hypothetical protein
MAGIAADIVNQISRRYHCDSFIFLPGSYWCCLKARADQCAVKSSAGENISRRRPRIETSSGVPIVAIFENRESLDDGRFWKRRVRECFVIPPPRRRQVTKKFSSITGSKICSGDQCSGSETFFNALPALSVFFIARSPRETIPTSRFLRSRTGSRRTCSSPMFLSAFSSVSSS